MADQGFLLDANGRWGTIDPQVFAAYADFLYRAGIIVDAKGNPLTAPPDWSRYLDTTVLSA
jgi:hypothetical protein